MVGGEGPFLGELSASFKQVSPASSLSFVTFPVLWGRAGSMAAAVRSVPSPAQQNPCSSAHPQLISTFCVLQGRLLQTKKSGYFPSSSVKPCPVDARVCAKSGAPAGAVVGWQGNFCSTLGGKRCPNKAFGSPQPIPVGFLVPIPALAVSPWCHLRSLVSVAVQENCPALCSVVLSGTSKFKKGSDIKKCSVLITGVLGREGGLAVTLPSQQRAVLSLQPPNSRPPSREIDYTAYPW